MTTMGSPKGADINAERLELLRPYSQGIDRNYYKTALSLHNQ
jgi:hypothetical protein